ncbi:MAG: DUF11 domain-containing protein, partial [Anaerolineales bacterium]|nr:DUF11 domain-containing protein [Anaerolineales bacterium]
MQPGSIKDNDHPLWPQLWAMVMALLRQLWPDAWPTLSLALLITLLLLTPFAGSGIDATSLPAIGEDGRPLVIVPRETVTVPPAPASQHRPDSQSNHGNVLGQIHTRTSGQAHATDAGLTQQLLVQNPDNPFVMLTKTGSQFAAPGTTVTYRVELANYEAMPLQFSLSEQLPPTLTYVAGSATGGLQVDGDTLRWTGSLAPGHLDYLVDETVMLPYLDLADYGVGNL